MFPATGLLECVSMDILGPLPRTKRGNEYALFITYSYSKMTQALSLSKRTALHVGNVFLEDGIIPYRIPRYFLIGNGPQFLAKFFAVVCAYLDVAQLNTTASNPLKSLQSERFNKTIVARLRHHVAEHQDDWDAFVQPLTYAYNNQVYCSTTCTPFSLVLTRKPPRTTTIIGRTAEPTDQSIPQLLAMILA